MESNRYYWLKLKRDFFKRHDIRIVEDMPNGKDYILFYLKMLVESVDHEGCLRFSDTIPYNEDMIATITNTNVDTVRMAMKIFTELGMMEVIDDGTIFMSEVQRMIGSASDTDGAKRQARFRERKKAELTGISEASVTNSNATVTDAVTNDNESKSKSKSKRQSKSKSICIVDETTKTSRFIPPTLEEVKAYCEERHNLVDPQRFFDYYQAGGWKDAKGNPVKNWKQKIITWEKHSLTDNPPVRQAQPSGNPFAQLLDEWGDEDE